MALLLCLAVGCDDPLEVNDPDLLTIDDLSGAKGAELLWGGAIREVSQAVAGSVGGHALLSALLSDEYYSAAVDNSMRLVDLRTTAETSVVATGFLQLHQARVAARNAAEEMEEALPDETRVGELWSLNGFTYLMLGEDFCSGVPFSQVSLEGDVVFGQPKTTEEIFEIAASRFETALSEAAGNADLEHLARIGLGRGLLNLGRYAEAAQAVASVPTEWRYTLHFGSDFVNAHYQYSVLGWLSISDGEGTVGLPFRSANDPRVPWVESGLGGDGTSLQYSQMKFSEPESAVILASGYEARYLEAEAALDAGDIPGFLGNLNEVREVLDMGPVADPGTTAGRVDLLFRERGFTFFGEGHRLGDLRRLVRQYGRSQDDVFPTGTYHYGGLEYGSDVNFVLPESEKDNPYFAGCLDPGA